MNPPFAPASSRCALSLGSILCGAMALLACTAPTLEAAPLPPLKPVATPAPATSGGGPKRPGPVVAPTTDPAEASGRQGGPRRPTGGAPSNPQPQDLTTAESMAQP